MIDFFRVIVQQMGMGNFSFPIFVAAVIQIIIMIWNGRRKKEDKKKAASRRQKS